MPMPVNNNCSARSMEMPGQKKLRGSIRRRTETAAGPSPDREGPATRSIVEVDVLVVDDGALLVPHDVVAVQAVAIGVEIIFAFGAGEFLQAENRLTDLGGIGRAGLVDRRRQDGEGIIGPGALIIGRGLVGVAIGFAE